MKQSTLKRFLRLPAFDEHLELHRIDCLSSHGQLDSYDYMREQLRSLPLEAIRPTPLITGRDLIEAGYEPGPRFKEVMTACLLYTSLIGLVVREAQTMADFGRHLDSDLDMAIEANAIGRNAKGRRLADVVQQRSPGESL